MNSSTSIMFAARQVAQSRGPDGSILLRSRAEMSDPIPSVLDWMRTWARETPDVAVLTQDAEDGRAALTYGDAWLQVNRVATDLISRGVEPGDRIAVLVGNGIPHFVIGFGAMLARAIYTPVAPQYLLDSSAGSKLDLVLQHLRPRLVVSTGVETEATSGHVVLAPAELLRSAAERNEAQVSAPDHFTQIRSDDVAKILLTSGTTGQPKPVAMTHRMMTSNMAMTFDVWPFLLKSKPEIVDWLPWNHAFGGSANVHLVISRGGTLHIDGAGGRPGAIDSTVRLLTHVRPTYHGTVPAGFAALIPALERDVTFRRSFFERLDIMFSAGASMNPRLHSKLRELSATVRDVAVPIVTGWGATELGPGATMVHESDAGPGNIGTPMPGVEVRLTPSGGHDHDKFELWVRSPSSAGAYWEMPEENKAFTEDGFYRTGDTATFVDPENPNAGLTFRGRVNEDFKLANGTWVDAAGVRDALLSASDGALRDVCVLGADQPHLAVFAWATDADHFGVDQLQQLIDRYNTTSVQRSRRIHAGIVASPEPSGNELSQKGQLVRSVIMETRAADIANLFAEESV